RPEPAPEPPESDGETPVFIPDTLLAIVRSGETPLWFELGPEGPALIDSPAEASEEPFTPWPQARHVTGLAVDGKGRLIMAVNRDGFLAWETREGGLGLYRISRKEAWDPYTAASLFTYQGTPGVLLCRDDFFPWDRADSPAVRVWGLSADFLKMEEMGIPAFAALPRTEGWDLDTLSLGKDGLWYYRGVRRESSGSEIRYFRTRDLSVSGESASVEVFRDAMLPYTEKDMPPPLRAVLEEAERLAGIDRPRGAASSAALAAAVVSPDFPARRYFAVQIDGTGEGGILEIAGFYRSPDTGAVVFPNGQGIFIGPGASAPKAFALPVLPEGFAYTRIGFAGPVLIVSWEEQQDWHIGAAGFMALNGP
ncbi:MAG: hypothetical protein LBP81_00170, partial [Treponema sp.]|nr:hypothetical protein [Treponema sp.]